MIFKELGAQSFTYRGVEITIGHKGPDSAKTAEFIQCELMPLVLAAPEMAGLLQRIIAGDFVNFPTMFDDVSEETRPFAAALRLIRDEARRLAPVKKVRR